LLRSSVAKPLKPTVIHAAQTPVVSSHIDSKRLHASPDIFVLEPASPVTRAIRLPVGCG